MASPIPTSSGNLKEFAKHRDWFTWCMLSVVAPLLFLGFWIPYLIWFKKSEQCWDVLKQGDLLLFSGLLLFTAAFEALSIGKLLTTNGKENRFERGGLWFFVSGAFILVLHAMNVNDVRLTGFATAAVLCHAAVAPVGATNAPVGATNAPVGATNAPVGATNAPVGATNAPGNAVSPPPVAPSINVNVHAFMVAAGAATFYAIVGALCGFLLANRRLSK